MKKIKTNVGILVHGAHLHANEWGNMVWGEPPLLIGRLPKAIQVYLKFGAKVIFFGTGASEKDGVREGQYTFNTLLEKKGEMEAFEAFKCFDFNSLKITPSRIYYNGIGAEVVVDTKSQDTREELLAAGDAFLERGVTDVVLVSNASHMPRCIAFAQEVYNDPRHEGKYKALAQGIMACPADTCCAGAGYGDVVIVEPPHRGDRSSYPIHRDIKRILKIPQGDLTVFGEELKVLIERFL